MSRSADPQLRRWWRELIDTFDSTQATVGEFCRRHEISTASFYRWRQRLARPRTAKLSQHVKGGAPVDSAFVPVHILNTEAVSSSQSVHVHLPGGVSIEMPVDQKELLFDLVARVRDEAGVGTTEAAT